MLQIFATKEKPRNDYLRWHDYSLKNLKMPKSVKSVFKTLKFKANPPMKSRFFFFCKKRSNCCNFISLIRGF
ncbi:hypothetical protein DD747_04075 [Helicobacter pylori]|nr:hypothetical protein DD747_04075 [Helicobacter pylori]